MNLSIYTGPDPGANLTEMLRRIPLAAGPICAVVPDVHSAKRIERKLAELTGEAFLGHRVLTLEGLALNIVSHGGLAPELIKDHTKQALLGEILRNRIGEKSPFFGVARYPGFLDVLVTYLHEIRSLDEMPIDDPPELVSLASAYELHLRRFGFTDHEGLVALALKDEWLDRFCAQFKGSLIIDGFYDLTERQFELLIRLFERFTRSAATLLYDDGRPSLFALPEQLLNRYRSIGAKIVRVEREPVHVPGCVMSGFMGGHYSLPDIGGDVQIHTFRDESAEADWVCGTIRSLIAGGACSPDDVMIVSRNGYGFGSPVHAALKRHGLPAEGSIGRPIIHHPLVRFVFDAIEASIRVDEKLIARVRQSGYTAHLSLPRQIPFEAADDRGWSCILAENDSPEGFVSSLKIMLDHLGVGDCLCGSCNDDPAVPDTAVYELLNTLLDEFAVLYTPLRRMMRISEFQMLLHRFLESVSVPALPRAPNGVIIIGANQARHIRRPVVFLAGLDNASFPRRHDTYSLHGSLRARSISMRHEQEERLLFYLAGVCAERLYLTFPGIDDEGREDAMSPCLEDIRDGIERWRKPEFHHGIPGAAWQGGAVNERGRAEELMRTLKRQYDNAPVLLAGLRRRGEALASRILDAIGDFIVEVHGHVETHGRASLCNGIAFDLREADSLEYLTQRWGPERLFSVTELERYLSCPAEYFLSRVLGLDVDRYEENEIAPADLGNVVHNVLAEFYTRRLKEHGKASFARSELEGCRQSMREIVGRAFSGDIFTARSFHPAVLIAERKLFLAWMDTFLEHEAEYFEETGFEPSLFESFFGEVDTAKPHPLTPSPPPGLTGGGVAGSQGVRFPVLTVESDGEEVLIRGRIDRIDCKTVDPLRQSDSATSGKRLFRVIDYKTGSGSASARDIEKGTSIQIPLYLKAAVEHILPDSSLYDGVLYFLRDMEMRCYRENRTAITGQSWEPYIEMAVHNACRAASGIRRGRFPTGSSCPDYCDFRPLCRGARLSMEHTAHADS